jgi:hypothetical protein
MASLSSPLGGQTTLPAGYQAELNAAPEWQERSYRYRCRLAGGLSTLGACSGFQLVP